MIIVRPVKVTDAVLTSTNLPENDAPEWQAGTTYAQGDTVMRTTAGVHSVYESIQAGNLGNPPENDDLVTPTWWARVSATNRWAMFSDQISDQSENADEIIVTLTPADLVNSIAFFNVAAASIHVVMIDPIEGTVYDNMVNLVDDSGVSDWYAWYFEPIVRQDTLALLDLPPYTSADITITLTRTGGVVGCGLVTMGAQRQLGETEFGTGVGIVDYSRKERDVFGQPVIVKRNFSRRADYAVRIDTDYADAVQKTLADLRTTPMTWIGDVSRPSTILYGYYRDFDVTLSNPRTSVLSLEVEGLT